MNPPEACRAALNGRPAEVAFHFALKLENPLFRWMQWQDGAYVPFALPAVRDTVTLPAPAVPFPERRDQHLKTRVP